MQAPRGQLRKSQGPGACWTRSLRACDWGRLGAGQELWVLQGQQGFPTKPMHAECSVCARPQQAGDDCGATVATRASSLPLGQFGLMFQPG